MFFFSCKRFFHASALDEDEHRRDAPERGDVRHARRPFGMTRDFSEQSVHFRAQSRAARRQREPLRVLWVSAVNSLSLRRKISDFPRTDDDETTKASERHGEDCEATGGVDRP